MRSQQLDAASRERSRITRIKIEHNVGRKRAREKIDYFLDELAKRELPAGIEIHDQVKNWSGDVMTLSFKAKRGFLGVNVDGEITVHDDKVVIYLNLSPLITSFISEDSIRIVITEQAESLLREND